KCSSCHSVTGDMRGIATKYSDPKVLQNTWVAGGGRPGRGAAQRPSAARSVTAKVAQPSGPAVEGRVVRIDDFIVTLELADGSTRTFRREGDDPKVELHDPMKGHRDLLSVYSDEDMHDLTAYL